MFNITGYDDEAGPTGQTRRLTFRNNLFTNVTGTLLQAGAEVGEVTVDHNTSMNAGTLIKLYRGLILQPDGAKRSGQYSIGTFTVLNSLMVYGEYGVWGEGSAIGTDALEDHTLSYDWRRDVVAGEQGWGHTFPPDTQQPTMDFYFAQFNPDYTLVAGSPYIGAALDGSDLGKLFATAPPPANMAPAASFTTSCSGNTCTFTDTSTDSDGTIASRSWNFGDGTTSGGQNPVHTYAASGSYQVTLTVTDDQGATASIASTVTIASSEPPPNATPVASFTFSCAVFDCGFTDTSTDADGSIVSWSWNFGDGTSSSLQNPTHTFTSGNYKVTLTVTDDDGATASVMRAVNIRRARR